jgi:hypothetical protein
LDDGVDALAMVANAAVRQAGLDWRELPVAIGGGVFAVAPTLVEAMNERLRRFGAKLPPRSIAPRAAATAAAWLAAGWHQRLEPQHSWVHRVAI